jgi:hypothetical protein
MIRISHPATYLPERRYIFDVIVGEFLALDHHLEIHKDKNVRVSLLSDNVGTSLVISDIFFQTTENEWLTTSALPKQPLQIWKLPPSLASIQVTSRSLPVIFGESLDAASLEYYQENESGAHLGLDVFGSAFLLLTGYEELAKDDRDEHDRFPAHASLSYQESFLDRPIINEYVEVLWAVFTRLWPSLQRKLHTYQVRLSHDVDFPLCPSGNRPTRVLLSTMADLIKRQDISLAAHRLHAFLQRWRGSFEKDPCNTFDFIMDVSEKLGRQSSFNFISGHYPDSDHEYRIIDPWIRKLLKKIHERGHEIGLHPSYDTYRDPVRTRQEFLNLRAVLEKDHIEQQEWGGRQHYLRWANPVTWQNWEDAGLDYDSTLGFPDHPGFRCGVCYEFPVFNLITRQTMKLRERPLLIMEEALISRIGHSRDVSESKLGALVAACQLCKGEMTLLWHNNNLISKRQKILYTQICQLL